MNWQRLPECDPSQTWCYAWVDLDTGQMAYLTPGDTPVVAEHERRLHPVGTPRGVTPETGG